MFSSTLLLALSFVSVQAAPVFSNSTQLPIHNITRVNNTTFENLIVRSNGQILTTTTSPHASVYQVDPLGILPNTLIHEIPNVTSATGIAEGEKDIFYIVSGSISITSPNTTVPDSYSITELDVREVFVFPNGTLNRKPAVKRVASLPAAALPNGADFARPRSENLLVADSFRGLIWNVNVCTGNVSIAVNDTTTKGNAKNPTGANGLKVHDGALYWTSTGTSSLFKVQIDEKGNVRAGQQPVLVTDNLPCDDFDIDSKGNVYVAGPANVITKVGPTGEKQIIAGTVGSEDSSLIGPTAARLGRGVSDRWSLYVTTDGVHELKTKIPGSAGISRIDLGL